MADQEGYGFLYPKKDRKQGQPNLTGRVTVHGREIELAAWKKTAKSGVPYLSVKATDKGAAEEAQRESDSEAPSQEELASSAAADDDIPF